MDYLYERIAYLRGLAEGMNLEEESKEGKVLAHIIDVLEDFADMIDELYENQHEIEEYMDTMDEDLADVEEDLYGDYDLEDEDFENEIDD